MLVSELIHYLKCKRKGKYGEIDLEIDISKACDWVNWGYLSVMMLKLGFDVSWVKWIMLCVTSVHDSVLVNSVPVVPIIPSRGLREGDPLSPCLFILCAEGLSTLINQAERRGDVHSVHICKRDPIISHMLFADDCFLFFRALSESVTQWRRF